MKRFDYVNNKWVKTQKVVNFPFKDFDPTAYLASIPQETILRHRQLQENNATINELDTSCDSQTTTTNERIHINEEQQSGGIDDVVSTTEKCKLLSDKPGNKATERVRGRARLESTSLQKTPVIDEHLKDYHQHKLNPGQDPFDLKYQLYAVVVSLPSLPHSLKLQRLTNMVSVFRSEPLGDAKRRPLHLVRVQPERQLVLLQRQLVQGGADGRAGQRTGQRTGQQVVAVQRLHPAQSEEEHSTETQHREQRKRHDRNVFVAQFRAQGDLDAERDAQEQLAKRQDARPAAQRLESQAREQQRHRVERDLDGEREQCGRLGGETDERVALLVDQVALQVSLRGDEDPEDRHQHCVHSVLRAIRIGFETVFAENRSERRSKRASPRFGRGRGT